MTVPSNPMPLDRRGFLAHALAAPVFPAASAVGADRPGQAGRLSLAEVLAGAHALIDRHLAGGQHPDDEAWVHAATALFAQLGELPPDPFGDMTAPERAFLQQHGWTFRRVDSVPADRRRPAVITHQIHIPPGGRIPLHDHRGMFGAIVGAAGECEIRSFDLVEGDRDTPTVALREMDRTWLGAGRFALLTRSRDNVHEFRAGKAGARLLDLFVWLDEDARSHDLEWIDDPSTAPADRRYRARWS